MNQLRGKTIWILGLGHSGLAMARWCTRWGANVTVVDTRPQPPQLPALQRDVPLATFVTVDAMASTWLPKTVDAVYRSPGLSPTAVSSMLKGVDLQGLKPGGELSLFLQALEELREERSYTPSILAVTGTNGKTTVTSLAGQLVERAGKSVRVAGNIGPTLLDSLTASLDADALPQVWVLELSSFQLDGVEDFEPSAATVLNLSQDHLDWHGSMESYASAKCRVFGKRTLMVLNRQDPRVMAMAPVEGVGKSKRGSGRLVQTFGVDMPTRPGDFGMESVNGMSWLVRAMEADETQRRRKGEIDPLHIQRLIPADALRIRGRHNAANALAALSLASAAGCALAPMLYGLREYRGEPHRVESVGVWGDVEYFDDSKGTNVGATVAALNGLGADRKIVVILGGDGKGQDFSPLVPAVAASARAAILIGRDAPMIKQVLAQSGVDVIDAQSMHDAVAKAQQRAIAGDAVLMSPACASFDMFDNYGHRAAVFRSAVLELAHAHGQSEEGFA